MELLSHSCLQSITGNANHQAFISVPESVKSLIHSLKVYADGSSILSGLVVKLYNRNWFKYCVMILLDAWRRVIMMISTEADNGKHFI